MVLKVAELTCSISIRSVFLPPGSKSFTYLVHGRNEEGRLASRRRERLEHDDGPRLRPSPRGALTKRTVRSPKGGEYWLSRRLIRRLICVRGVQLA